MREALAASDAELLIHLFQDIDAGMIDRDEIGIIFKGAMPWSRIINAIKAAHRDAPAPAALPSRGQPSPTSSSPERPDKAAILRKLRAKTG